ncbi:MAG: hypothetical protein PWQ37_1756 [Candidatus Petromonas sp.]|jgi:hypothetical protein|nr:hypothetical protein [Candidatus Petromonas sp.]
MFLEAAILGLLIGIIRKGRFSNLAEIKINGWILIFIAVLLQLLPLLAPAFPFVEKYQRYFYIASTILILFVVTINLNKKGFRIISIGVLLNLFVMLMNGFKMPIYLEGLKFAGLESIVKGIETGDILNYMPLEKVMDWTKYFGKFIVVPKPYPLAKVISVGDIFMSLGIVLFIQGEMTKSYLTMKSRMIRMGYKSRW